MRDFQWKDNPRKLVNGIKWQSDVPNTSALQEWPKTHLKMSFILARWNCAEYHNVLNQGILIFLNGQHVFKCVQVIPVKQRILISILCHYWRLLAKFFMKTTGWIQTCKGLRNNKCATDFQSRNAYLSVKGKLRWNNAIW